MDLRFHHNFRNQLPCSPFQEEPIAKSIGDMIQTKNSVTQPINRLDLILSELINRSEGILSYQSLPILIPLTLSMEPKNHVVLEAKIEFQHTHLNLTKIKILRTTLIFWQVISFLKLNLSMNIIRNLNLAIQFNFLTQ